MEPMVAWSLIAVPLLSALSIAGWWKYGRAMAKLADESNRISVDRLAQRDAWRDRANDLASQVSEMRDQLRKEREAVAAMRDRVLRAVSSGE